MNRPATTSPPYPPPASPSRLARLHPSRLHPEGLHPEGLRPAPSRLLGRVRVAVVVAGVALLSAPAMLGRAPARADSVPLGGFKVLSQAEAIDLQYNDGSQAKGSVPQAETDFTTGIGRALAAVAYPGPVGGNPGALAGTLLTGKVPGPVLQPISTANYPIKAQANSGGRNDAVYPPSGPPQAFAAKAHADAASASATGQLAGGTIAAVGTFGASSAQSATTVTPTKVSTSAMSVASNVVIAGAVRIGKVTSTATATSDGVTGKGGGKTTFEGFSVGGQTVDVSGATAGAGPAKVPLPVAASLNPAIKALGLQIEVTAPDDTVNGAMVIHHSGAVVIAFTPPQSGQAFVMTLGGAEADANATPGFNDTVSVPPAAGATDAGGGAVSAPVATGGGGPAPSAPSGGSASVPATSGDVGSMLYASPLKSPSPSTAGATTAPSGDGGASLPTQPAASTFGGLAPGLVVLGLGAIAAGAFGLGKVPDDVLAEKAVASPCPLERSQP